MCIRDSLMPDFAEPVERLIDQLKHLPGIGAKTAQRLAFHILRSDPESALALAAAIRDAKLNMRICSVCNNITDVDPCLYCTSSTRSRKTICVVEEPHNIMAIEKRASTAACITCWEVHSRPCEGSGPINCT